MSSLVELTDEELGLHTLAGVLTLWTSQTAWASQLMYESGLYCVRRSDDMFYVLASYI